MITHIATSSLMEVLSDAFTTDGAENKTSSWNFQKLPGMLYVTARAVSVGTNGNADHFTYDELKLAWSTFIGKGVFVNHLSSDIEAKRGKIVDAKFIDNGDNEGTYVVCLMEVNAKAFPALAEMIKAGMADSVSMGVRVSYSNCSVCQHKAVSTKDYCNHIKFNKGGIDGFRRVYEINHGLEFQELSFVAVGADSQAKILEIIAKQARLHNQDVRQLWAAASKDASFADNLLANQREMELIIVASIKFAKKMKEIQ